MINITTGTAKQNAYANDIIRKPVNALNKSISIIEHDVQIMADKDPAWAENQRTVIIPILNAALKYYDQAMDLNEETFTAKYVIDNYTKFRVFESMMWDCIRYAFREAGLDCNNPSAWLLY